MLQELLKRVEKLEERMQVAESHARRTMPMGPAVDSMHGFAHQSAMQAICDKFAQEHREKLRDNAQPVETESDLSKFDPEAK